MMNSIDVHTTERTGERRVAVLASIRVARNMGRAWNVAAVTREWSGFGVLLGCMVIPLVSLAVDQTGARRHA